MNEYASRLEKIEAILRRALPLRTPSEESLLSFGTVPDAVRSAHLAPLVAPCRELIERGGKRWRPLLMVLCAEAATEDADMFERVYRLTPLVELAHTASLIHDDIEDASAIRRGAPCAYLTWGTDTAINAASWLYFQAAACIQDARLPAETQNRLYRLVAEELRRLHLGQAMDIAWHKDSVAYPAISEYVAMTRLKTGTLASLAAKTSLTAVGADSAVVSRAGSLAADAGVAFQIFDDVRNLTTGNPGKKRGDDLAEGKKSYPILLHLTEHPDDFPFVSRCFEQARREGADSPATERCADVLEKSGTLSKATGEAQKMILESADKFRMLFPAMPENAARIAGLFKKLLQ